MLEAINRLLKLYPDAEYSQLRAMVQAELDEEIKAHSGQGKYERAAEAVQKNIQKWIETAPDYLQSGVAAKDGALDVTSTAKLLQFIATHRHATVWAVLFGLSRKGK